jgi:predicted lactoylglutathione lyase
MATKIFVNLPVKKLDSSINFFRSIGYPHNPEFTDETGACIVISEDIYVMILTHEKFKEFTRKEISDSSKTSEVIVALAVDSKEKVNELVENAIKAGGTQALEAKDYGFMFQRSFQDLDGHLWEVVWMDLPAATQTN